MEREVTDRRKGAELSDSGLRPQVKDCDRAFRLLQRDLPAIGAERGAPTDRGFIQDKDRSGILQPPDVQPPSTVIVYRQMAAIPAQI